MGVLRAKCDQCWDTIPCVCPAQQGRDHAATVAVGVEMNRLLQEQNDLLREQNLLLQSKRQLVDRAQRNVLVEE